MTQRAKLDLQLNEPVTIELLYDECVEGKNSFGSYYLYAVKAPGGEYSFFAPEQVHAVIKDLRRGECATITKQAVQKNGKVVISYDVQCAVKETVPAAKPLEGDPSKPANQQGVPIPESTMDDIKDNLYYTMIRCYRQAIAIQQELGGMIDVEKAAVTLFIASSKGIAGVNSVPGR